MDIKISIIMPCYNVERFLDRSLKSVIEQSFSDWELIIVNDGSTDNSLDVINTYSDKRIKCITQENAGCYAARNKGMEYAQGEYIGFIDPDDYIEKNMYEKLYNAITRADADMAVCNFNLVYDDPECKTRTAYAHMSSGVIDIYDNVYSYWVNNCGAVRPNNYVWSRIYNKKVLKETGIVFERYMHGEDTLFNYKLLPNLKRVAFVNEGLYNYVQHRASMVHNSAKIANLANMYLETYQALVDYYKEKNFTEFFEILPIHAYSRFRSVFFYSRLCGMPDDKIIDNLLSTWQGHDIYDYLTDKRK